MRSLPSGTTGAAVTEGAVTAADDDVSEATAGAVVETGAAAVDASTAESLLLSSLLHSACTGQSHELILAFQCSRFGHG